MPTINFMSDFMGALYIVMCVQNGKRFSVFIPLYSVRKRLWLPLCAFALIVWIDWIPRATEMVTITEPLAAQNTNILKPSKSFLTSGFYQILKVKLKITLSSYLIKLRRNFRFWLCYFLILKDVCVKIIFILRCNFSCTAAINFFIAR